MFDKTGKAALLPFEEMKMAGSDITLTARIVSTYLVNSPRAKLWWVYIDNILEKPFGESAVTETHDLALNAHTVSIRCRTVRLSGRITAAKN